MGPPDVKRGYREASIEQIRLKGFLRKIKWNKIRCKNVMTIGETQEHWTSNCIVSLFWKTKRQNKTKQIKPMPTACRKIETNHPSIICVNVCARSNQSGAFASDSYIYTFFVISCDYATIFFPISRFLDLKNIFLEMLRFQTRRFFFHSHNLYFDASHF